MRVIRVVYNIEEFRVVVIGIINLVCRLVLNRIGSMFVNVVIDVRVIVWNCV